MTEATTQPASTKQPYERPSSTDSSDEGSHGLSIIEINSWRGLLHHRMATGGLVTLIKILNYDQWSSIMDCAFSGLLAIRTKSIPKATARWLLESYVPWETSLNLPNGKIPVYDEDVHATLGLPIRPVQIQDLKTLYINPKYDKILER